MTSFFEQLKKESREIRLTPAERARMREALELSMRGFERSQIRVTPSPLLFFTLSSRVVASLAFVLVIVVVGGGTIYAAEGALPGDLLYSVKVGLNEPLRVAFVVSSEERVAVHSRFAERRLEEAQVLTIRGALTNAAKAELAANFEEHAIEAEAALAMVKEQDPVAAADVAARLGSRVEAHGAILEKLALEVDDEESRRESEDLGHALKERGRKLARADRAVLVAERKKEADTMALQAFSEAAPALPSEPLSLEDPDAAVVARIELSASTTLDEAEALLETLRSNLNASTTARVKEQIGKTRNSLKKIHSGFGTSSNKQKIEKALKDAATLKVFIEAQEKFQERVLLPVPDFQEDEESDDDSENYYEERSLLPVDL